MSSAIVENAVGGLIASETHGLIALLLSRISEEIKLLKSFNKELDELQRQLTRVYGLLDGASTHQPNTNLLMLDWLQMVKNAAYDAEDLIDEYSYEALKWMIHNSRKRDKLKVGVSYPFSHLRIAHQARDLRKLIGTIYAHAQKLGIKPIKVAAGEVYNRSMGRSFGYRSRGENPERRLLNQRQWVDHENLLGREEDLTLIVKLLQEASNSCADLMVVGIVGLAGLGKTALCKQVSKVQRVTECFDLPVIWLAISQRFELRDTLNRMVEIVCGEYSNRSDIQAIVEKLQEKLKGKRFLLILDDVWGTTDWKSLRSALHEIGGSKGTSILVTSRERKVVAKMETYNNDNRTIYKPTIHLMQGLNEDSSWSLFMARMNVDNLASREKELMARRMIRKCGGVPLAIRALGDLLREQDFEGWREIEKSDAWTKVDEYGILPSLKLSFNYLPNTALKKCFSYCAIFGEDEAIKKIQLIYMWMAQGFLQSNNEIELQGKEAYNKMEKIGEEYIEILLSSSLLLEEEKDEFGNAMTFKMHDLVWSLAGVVSKECLELKSPTPVINYGSRTSDVRHLRLTRSFTSEDIAPTFFKKLRTCILKDSCRSSSFLWNCSHLRVLCFSYIHKDSSWGKFMRSETLSSLKNLRYLDISISRDYLKQVLEQVTKLYHLQTLWIRFETTLPDMRQPILCFPKKLRDLVNMRHIHFDDGPPFGIPVGLCHLTALQTLPPIDLIQESGGTLDELELLNNLRRLEVRNIHIDHSTSTLNVPCRQLLAQKSWLESLVLHWGDSSCYDHNQMHSAKLLEALQPHENLSKLEIRDYPGITFPGWLVDKSSPLHNLVFLKLVCCTDAADYLSLENFKHLRFLSLISCNQLTIKFPDPNQGFQCLKLMEELEMYDCRGIEDFPELSLLTQLRVLDIRRCIGRRYELVGLASLPCLRELRTDGILPANLGIDSPICKSLQTLKLSGILQDDKKLPLELQHLVALQVLEISNFRSLETLPNWLGNLTSLRNLVLDYLPNLKSGLSEGLMQRFSNLKTFKTYGCPFL